MSTATDPSILSSKRAVYVGGLDKNVTPTLLRAAMLPFGNIQSLDMVRHVLSSMSCVCYLRVLL